MLQRGKFIFNWFGAGGGIEGVSGKEKTCPPDGVQVYQYNILGMYHSPLIIIIFIGGGTKITEHKHKAGSKHKNHRNNAQYGCI